MKARFVRIDRKIEIAENAKSSSKKLDLWANSGKVQHADFQSLCTCSESSLTNPIRRVGRESISYLECSFLTAHCLTKVRFRPRQRPWVRGLLRVRNEFSMIYAQNIGSEQISRYLVLMARVKNAVHMRVFPTSGEYLPLKLYAITKQTRFRPQNSKK